MPFRHQNSKQNVRHLPQTISKRKEQDLCEDFRLSFSQPGKSVNVSPGGHLRLPLSPWKRPWLFHFLPGSDLPDLSPGTDGDRDCGAVRTSVCGEAGGAGRGHSSRPDALQTGGGCGGKHRGRPAGAQYCGRRKQRDRLQPFPHVSAYRYRRTVCRIPGPDPGPSFSDPAGPV